MNDFSGFPNRLRLALKETNLTQVEVARTLNISKHTLTKYLQGRIPESSILYALSQLCGKPMEWFLIGETAAAPHTSIPNVPCSSVDTTVPYIATSLADASQEYSVRQDGLTTTDSSFQEWIAIFHKLSPDARLMILGMIRAIIANLKT